MRDITLKNGEELHEEDYRTMLDFMLSRLQSDVNPRALKELLNRLQNGRALLLDGMLPFRGAMILLSGIIEGTDCASPCTEEEVQELLQRPFLPHLLLP